VGVIDTVRRRAVAVGLALVLGQGASVAVAAATYAADLMGISDCCAKGSHPPGMCPLHRRAKPSTTCRLSCAASTSGPAVLMSAITLPASPIVARPAAARLAFFDRASSSRETIPVSPTPPPRS